MKTITTGGMRMPALGLGTWLMRGADARQAVARAIGLGYRHIDTARSYENEEAVGAGIADAAIPREQLHVTTKVWFDHLEPAAMRASFDASLAALGLDYVDLFLVHWPTPEMDLRTVLDTLVALRESGRTRAIGVSNFTVPLMRQVIAHGAPVACNQVEYHALLSQERLLALCRPHGIALTAYAPLVRGLLAELPALQAIAARHDATPAQVALAWLLAQDLVAAIPKAARRETQAANLAAADLVLDAGDMAAIAALPKDQRIVSPAFAPRWDAP